MLKRSASRVPAVSEEAPRSVCAMVGPSAPGMAVANPKAKAGPGELVVKVLASGICGTEVLEWYRIKKAPRGLGQEIAGESRLARAHLAGDEDEPAPLAMAELEVGERLRVPL